MSPVDDMLSWLRQQIEARKALAEAADAASPGPWTNTGQDGCGDAWQIHGAPTGETEPDWDSPDMEEIPVLSRVATLNYDDGGGVWEQAAADHIVLNQPRDVIARCDAELAILDWHTGAHECSGPGDNCLWVRGGDEVCPTARMIAFGYRHCPGWGPAWAPEG